MDGRVTWAELSENRRCIVCIASFKKGRGWQGKHPQPKRAMKYLYQNQVNILIFYCVPLHCGQVFHFS